MKDNRTLSLGAVVGVDGGTLFRVWAPFCSSIKVCSTEGQELTCLERNGEYFCGSNDNLSSGAEYFLKLDDTLLRPDPVSRFLGRGLHGPTTICDPRSFSWEDGDWQGRPIEDYVIYELHVGTFGGTFDAVIERMAHLVELGVTAIELMPVAQFPGKRNWGYDGASLFAVQDSYGGPQGLKRLVNAAHQAGLAVVLDVVYNHLGPEGNYLADFGPYFTDRYHTPWGDAVNFDGPYSDGVREFVIQNALYWINEYHIDALRLDAVHAIYDFSAQHILQELGQAVHSAGVGLGRRVHLIAESDLNDVRLLRPVSAGGYGLCAQWSDDFHHSVHCALTGEKRGYYLDFGGVGPVAEVIERNFFLDGRYSEFRKRRHGSFAGDLPASKFVVAVQNHDQVGNRAFGERFSTLLSFEQQKLAAALLLLSPFVPLLFMGEEYGEKAPFLYFVDHQDSNLLQAVRDGRRREFESFGWGSDIPDPGALDTFEASIPKLESKFVGLHAKLYLLYKEQKFGTRQLIPNFKAL